jgi:DNA topoisomerase-1
MKFLVVVESPSKCQKIASYLNEWDPNNTYDVVATMGHITELNSLSAIDITNKYKCKYEIVAGKKKQIDKIKKAVESSDEVILATDDDREGESIAYHVCQVCKLDAKQLKRIVFHEITKPAIIKALQEPRVIDMNKVRAQQARQIMDLLVGFQISPQLWKHILKKGALSAGRCQTPALRLIYDNQVEIENSEATKMYQVSGTFSSQNLIFKLDKKFESREEVEEFLEGSQGFRNIFQRQEPTKSTRKQPDPFITSTLQQMASNELHMSPKETMMACLTLYEAGYITYMRTDSKVYSKEFLETVKSYVKNTLNLDESKYLVESLLSSITLGANAKTPVSKTQVNKTQDAHEAIRPTDILVKETNLPASLGSREKRLYKLIWRNTLESCLPPAIFSCVKISLSAFKNANFIYTSERLDFPGFKIVSPNAGDTDPHYIYLQSIKQNSIMEGKKIEAITTIQGKKPHYTEAKLVQLLEEKGIGRPSTFSSLVEKIQEKEYVRKQDVAAISVECVEYELDLIEGTLSEETITKEFGQEKNKLVLTPLGKIVSEFLSKHFENILNYDFTREMEEQLDLVAKSEKTWYELCHKCNELIQNALASLDSKNSTKEKRLFSQMNQDSEDPNAEDPEKKDPEEDPKEDPEEEDKIFGTFESHTVKLKKGKFGLYAQWGTHSRALKELGNRPIESITFAEVEPLLQESNTMIREVSSVLSIRRGPKGSPYIFYKTAKMKKPQFFSLTGFKEDCKTCDMSKLKKWLEEKYDL